VNSCGIVLRAIPESVVHVLQVGNNTLSTRGGTPKAINDVRRAIGGDIVSFTNPHLVPEPEEGVFHIPQSTSPAGRVYGWAPARVRAQAASCFDRCDVVLIHGLFRFHYQWAVNEARRRARPYLIFPHGSLDPAVFAYRAPQKELWWALVGRPGLHGAAGTVFTSRLERDKAAARGRLPRPHVIALPVDAARKETPEVREQARRRLGIDPAHRVVLFLGRLHRIKRLSTVIRAFNRAALPTLHLIVAGPDGEDTAAGCAQQVAPALRSQVHFLGPVYGDDKRAAFAAADAFVSVSSRENFGYSLCEALAQGLPAIVGPGNDLAPDLRQAACAWLLDSDDDAPLADRFRQLAQAPPGELEAIGERGRAWVEAHLAFGQFRSALQQACRDALS